MTNRDLAELRDPERRQAEWWELLFYPKGAIEKCHGKWAGFTVRQGHRYFEIFSAYGDLRKYEATDEWRFTGPDWHVDDLACFRDWRLVLLAAGLDIDESYGTTIISGPRRPRTGGFTPKLLARDTYRAAILAAVAWLAEHKPELLREAIARVKGAANG